MNSLLFVNLQIDSTSFKWENYNIFTKNQNKVGWQGW